ncbi:MAG: hypothetical protein ACQEQV_05195 [Fibrobacterota bacterium]
MNRLAIALFGLILLIGSTFAFYFYRHQQVENRADHLVSQMTPLDCSLIQNGTYRGSYEDFLLSVTVDVRVREGRISEVRVVSPAGGTHFYPDSLERYLHGLKVFDGDFADVESLALKAGLIAVYRALQ